MHVQSRGDDLRDWLETAKNERGALVLRKVRVPPQIIKSQVSWATSGRTDAGEPLCALLSL